MLYPDVGQSTTPSKSQQALASRPKALAQPILSWIAMACSTERMSAGRQFPDALLEPLLAHRRDLVCHRLAPIALDQNIGFARIETADVTRHRDDLYSIEMPVGRIVADDDSRAGLTDLSADRGIEAYPPDLTAPHRLRHPPTLHIAAGGHERFDLPLSERRSPPRPGSREPAGRPHPASPPSAAP